MLRPSPNHGTQRLPNDDEFGGLGLGFRVRVLVVVRVWVRGCVRVTVGARVMVGVGLVWG